MKAPIKEQTWFAVYNKASDGTARPVALFESEEDANAYHCNPEVYVVLRRKVRLMPAPITVAPIFHDLAVEYCRKMADPEWEVEGDFFDELRSFIVKHDEAAGLLYLGSTPDF